MIEIEEEAFQVVISPAIKRAFLDFLDQEKKTLSQLVFADEDTGQLSIFAITDEEDDE